MVNYFVYLKLMSIFVSINFFSLLIIATIKIRLLRNIPSWLTKSPFKCF